MSTLFANPVDSIANGAPRLIQSEEQLATYTEALFHLTALTNPSPTEVEAIDLLTLLIDHYERQHYPIPKADPVSVLRFLIEQEGIPQRSLTPQFGSESAVSMFLTGQRQLTVAQIKKLSIRFNLPADAFLGN